MYYTHKYFHDTFTWPHPWGEPRGWDDMIEGKKIITRMQFTQKVYWRDMFKALKMNNGRFHDFTRAKNDLNYCRFFKSKLYGQPVYGIIVTRNTFVFRWQPKEKWAYLEQKVTWKSSVLI